MDKQVKVVIGANYGDEGKGLVSCCLAEEAVKEGRKVLTVLYNGGQQRAHTAHDEIFHCAGAGSYVGSDTFYRSTYLVDPIALWLERPTRVHIDPMCRVVIPSDVINNQDLEIRKRRDGSGDGTCGMGIFEACKRSKKRGFSLYALDLKLDAKDLYEKLIRIEKTYGFPRDILYNNGNFLEAVEWVIEHCDISNDWEDMLNVGNYDTIIYEGGQGLLLDQMNRDNFPHLTPSSVGLRYIGNEIRDLGVEDTQLYYVSRSYLTRHGSGPIENPCGKDDINPSIIDETNKPNPWQGELRFGFLNQGNLKSRIFMDVAENMNMPGKAIPKINLVYTHLNYTDGKLASEFGQHNWEEITKPSWANHVFGSDKKDFMDILI